MTSEEKSENENVLDERIEFKIRQSNTNKCDTEGLTLLHPV